MIKRLPWLRKRKKTDPEVPLRLPVACGPDTARTRLIRKLVFEKAESISRREGVDRREFMASACGMATTLYVINLVNGCSSSHRAADNTLGTGGRSASHEDGGRFDAGNIDPGRDAGAKGGSGSGGFTGITDAALEDPDAAGCALGDGGDELIIDMQTHRANLGIANAGLPDFGTFTNDRYPWIQRTPGCVEKGSCWSQQEYIDQIFMNSDTTISVLAGTPYSIGPDGTGSDGFATLSNEDLLAAAKELDATFPNRILTQCAVMPNDRLDLQLVMMERSADSFDNWNTSPLWSPNRDSGYWLDENAGQQMLQKGIDHAKPIFSIYKGFPLESSSIFANPKDVGPACLMFPKAYFVIRHAAFEFGLAAGDSSLPSSDDPLSDVGWGPGVGQWPEGPYDESLEALGDMQPTDKGTFPLNRGINSLIKSLRDAGIGPNGARLDDPNGGYPYNVYAECGSAWPSLMMGRVEEAMHFWGKLMKYVGEERIVWGTDCLWFGCPQPIIQAFRSFEVSEEFQAKFGYPALTPERKEKILGRNAARLQSVVTHRIDPFVRCHSVYVGNDFLRRKRDLDDEFGVRRDMIRDVPAPHTRRDLMRRAIRRGV